MKKWFYLLIAINLLSINFVNAQNPFKELGVDVGVITLSKGKYIEFIPNDSIQRIGTVVINVNSGEIIELINTDSVEVGYNYKPYAASRWISPDPLAEEYWNWSPYNYCENNPISNIDPDGTSTIPNEFNYIASTFITPKGEIIEHRNDGDPTIYIVTDPNNWNGEKDGLTVFGYEKPGVDYESNIGNNIANAGFILLDPRKYPYDPPLESSSIIESTLIPSTLIIKLYRLYKFLKNQPNGLSIGEKIQKQMNKRGWTEETINETIKSPVKVSKAQNKANGNPASAYFNKDGSYVVKDNSTNEVIQVSNRNDPNWIPDPTIQNPYIPKK